jgi:phosphate transport system protein
MSDPTLPPSPRDYDDHHRDLSRLKHHIAEMSVLATGMVADGTRALLSADAELSQSVISRAAPLDRFDLEVEIEAIRLVAVLQPEGPDLRSMEAALKIATCVDRIGRLGYDLGRYVVPAPRGSDAPIRELLRQMDAKARAMVVDAVEAFLAGDAARAKAVFAADDEVDGLNRQIQAQVIALLRKGGPDADRLAYELLGARHLERVADNACKIAEKTVYAVTGERRTEYFPALAHKMPIPNERGAPVPPRDDEPTTAERQSS